MKQLYDEFCVLLPRIKEITATTNPVASKWTALLKHLLKLQFNNRNSQFNNTFQISNKICHEWYHYNHCFNFSNCVCLFQVGSANVSYKDQTVVLLIYDIKTTINCVSVSPIDCKTSARSQLLHTTVKTQMYTNAKNTLHTQMWCTYIINFHIWSILSYEVKTYMKSILEIETILCINMSYIQPIQICVHICV